MTRIGNMRNAYLNDLVVDGVVRNKTNKAEKDCACDAWNQLTLDRVLTDSRERSNSEVARRFSPATCSNQRKSFAIYHTT